MRIAIAFAVVSLAAGCHLADNPAPAQSASPVLTRVAASAPTHWKRANNHRGAAAVRAVRGMAATAEAATACSDVAPLQLYRFIEPTDTCMQPMTPAAIAALGDPFAVNVLAKGLGNAALWPTDVESVVRLVAAVPGFGTNQLSYMLGEGSQITTAVTPRESRRDLRYVVTWGANASPTVFLSAVPSGTHPGLPPPFLQVIGYDAQRNVFNYYEFISNPQQPTTSWAFAGSSDNARDPRTAGKGCMQCHINGALNMKELVPPWNNWNSPAANISPNNVPLAVANDPLYTMATGADRLQNNFQSLQTRYSQGLVATSISGTTISNIPALLRRLITTTTVNFTATPAAVTNSVQIPSDFFLAQGAFGTSQIGLAFTLPTSFTVPASAYDSFLTSNAFALQQLTGTNAVAYQQEGGNFFPLFVPAPAYEDVAMIQQMINQKVIDANFAASVLLVDFPNPVFSATRNALLPYAGRITTAQKLGSGANPNGIPAQFLALVQAAAANQPACNTGVLLQCTAEQQFLFYAGQSDWKTRATGQVNPYFAAVTQRLATDAGVTDYLTLWASRQAQFANAPGVGNLDEFSLLLPCNTLPLPACKRMNADGTISYDPSSSCGGQVCAPSM